MQGFTLLLKSETAFKEAHTGLLTVDIVEGRAQQPHPKAGTHYRHILGDGIFQHQGRLIRINALLPDRIDETVGNGFLITPIHQCILDSIRIEPGFGHRAHVCLQGQWPTRQAIIPVHPANFLNQIGFQMDVEAE